MKLVLLDSPLPQEFPVRAMFVVPKRNHKRAHDRNKLKRRMREAYRLQKQVLYQALTQEEKKLQLAFIYTSRKAETYQAIQSAVKKLIEKSILKPVK